MQDSFQNYVIDLNKLRAAQPFYNRFPAISDIPLTANLAWGAAVAQECEEPQLELSRMGPLFLPCHKLALWQ
jgi:hypothetical protein